MYVAAANRYQDMTYNRLGTSGLKLPAISLGLWHNFGHQDPQENMIAMLTASFDAGITHFDLANNYGPAPGAAETNFGMLFKRLFTPYRDELIISTKAGFDMWEGPYGNFGSRKYLLASLDQSLKRMQLDYVDIFYSHRMDPETDLEASFDRTIERNGLKAKAKSLGKGIIAFSPLAQGLLSDRYLNGISADSRVKHDGRFLHESDVQKYHEAIVKLNEIAHARGQSLAQMALAWVLKDGAVASVLIGASKVSQIHDNIGALQNTTFSAEELSAIDQACAGLI